MFRSKLFFSWTAYSKCSANPSFIHGGLLLAICEPRDDNYNFDHMHDYLFERGFTIYPGKGAREATFRLAVIGQIFKEDIQNFLEELSNYLQELNIKTF